MHMTYITSFQIFGYLLACFSPFYSINTLLSLSNSPGVSPNPTTGSLLSYAPSDPMSAMQPLCYQLVLFHVFAYHVPVPNRCIQNTTNPI